jgi:hypothetical protein
LLPWLLGAAIGAAGILQGLHWRSSLTRADQVVLEDQLRTAKEENEILRRENDSLRSLAQGGGELAIPQEFIDRTEKEFGLHFISSPTVHRLAGEELRGRIAAAIESRCGPSGIDDRQTAYSRIGWLGQDDDLLDSLAAVSAVGARTWFDDTSGDGWVTDRFDLQNITDQAALVRMLARILFHQHFPPSPAYPGDDAARARDALHQGVAAGSESRFLAWSARTNGFLPMKENREASQLLASLAPSIQGLTKFFAIEGKGFADTLYLQGNDKLHAAFKNPPLTTRAILCPGVPIPEPVALELPVPPEEPFLTESAGQLGLRLWLEASADPTASLEISSCWINDRYFLIPDGAASTAVLWDIELNSAAAADQLQAAALIRISAPFGLPAPLVGKIITCPEGRNLRVSRLSPVRIRFLNTATPSLAEKFS